MQPVAKPLLKSIAFLMVAGAISSLMLGASWVSGFVLAAGVIFFGLANKLGASARNPSSRS